MTEFASQVLSQYGMAGLVIAALSTVIVWFGRNAVSTFRELMEKNQKILESHKEERAEIIERFDKALERNETRSAAANRELAESMKEVAAAIRERRTP